MVKKIVLGVLGFLLGTAFLGFIINVLILRLLPSLFGMYEGQIMDYRLLFRGDTYLYGAVVSALFLLIFALFARPSAKKPEAL